MLFKPPQIGTLEKEVIDQIEEARQKLRHSLARPRRWTGMLRRDTFARAIQGSNSIEGYNVTAEDAIAAAEGEEPLDADREAWLAVTGYRTAMTFVLELAKDKSFVYNEGFLRSLHFMMLQHDLSKHPGNWRPGTVYVRQEPTGEVVYEGPDVESVPGLVAELIDFLNCDDDDCDHVLIKGAMAHLNLVLIHPFSDGNGRMARCLQALVLARDGILESQFCSIEEYLGRNTPAYYEVLARTAQGSWSPRNSTKEWIQFNLTAHFRQACTILRRSKVLDLLFLEADQIIKQLGFPERTLNAICSAAMGLRVRNSSYRNLAELNDILASRDLKNLVAAGLLIPQGERRGRLYVGSPQIRAIFDRLKREHMRPIPDPFTTKGEQLELPNPP
ncbi:MAG: Fic family protein [Terracidiphilus sp.]